MDKRYALTAALALTLAALPAAAQARRTASDDSSSIGIARITSFSGDANVLRRAGDVVAAESGAPLAAGDTLRTPDGARAELRLGPGNYIRVTGAAELRVRQLGERYYQLELARGSASYTMFDGAESDVEIRTSCGSAVPRKPGVYRISALDARDCSLITRRGEAELLAGSNNVIVKKNKEALVRDGNSRLVPAPRKDGFDDWAERRDDMVARDGFRSPRYPVMLGGGWGWGGPYFYDPFWYPYPYYSYGPRVAVVVAGGGRGHGGHRR